MPNVYLIGMPGCGKTTLAQGAALELNRPFLDLDEVCLLYTSRCV